MISLGIVGAGTIVRARHIPEIELCAACTIGGFSNRTAERASELAAAHGGTAYGSLDQMLADPAIDAVLVANANALHAEVTIAALQAGKHVLCEKPMATTAADCQAMIDAAQANGRKLMLGHNMRTEPSSVLARRLLAEQVIGRVVSFQTIIGNPGPEHWSIDAHFDTWFYQADQAGFGAIADLGVHKIDLMRYLLDDEIAEVMAYVGTLDKQHVSGREIAVDDYTACLLKTRGGAVGNLIAAWSFYGEEDYSTVIRGSQGVMKIYADPTVPVVVTTADGSRSAYTPAEQMIGDERNSGLVEAFAACIENDTDPPITGADGLASVQIIEACVASSRERRAVAL